MSNRCVVSFADTPRYQRGLGRLSYAIQLSETSSQLFWHGLEPEWPSHQEKPYAFKAYAIHEAYRAGFETLLWADSCILPVADLEPLWQKIETEGYWIARNGWNNYQWTAGAAYPYLFPDHDSEYARKLNKEIPHVVATAFGISLKHAIGLVF